MTPPHEATIHGQVAGGFEPVRLAFADNFAEHAEHGAGLCVLVDDVVVVDLWGGWCDAASSRPWTADTLVNVFSVGKGLAAVVVAGLVGEGALDPDAPVVEVWPELGAAGKAAVTTTHLLSHRAGLPAIEEVLEPDAMLDWDRMVGALERQAPWWEPGTAHGYHVNTYGHLVGEVVRRVSGHRYATALTDRVARPAAADIHIGFGPELDVRVADLLWDVQLPSGFDPADLPEEERLRYLAYVNPSGYSGAGVINSRAWRAAEIPSTNTHASARGVAAVYAELARGGGALVAADALRAATTERSSGTDRVLGRPSRFGAGFQLTMPERPLGPGPRAFGHFGAGGSLGFCDPDLGLAFGYVMNSMGSGWQNPRNRALIDAVATCVASR